MGQILGTTTSSVVLLLIALDRYQNVTVAIVSQRWNPSVWKCVAVAFIFLLVCTGKYNQQNYILHSLLWFAVASYPMYILFTLNSIQIVYPDGPELVFEDAFLCVAVEKDKLKVYYMVLAVMVFLPIIVTFIWFYYQIAAMVWRHRKPPLSKYHHSKPSCNKIPSVFVKRTRTVQVQRKIRTFKVIIVLMVAFVACRLPYWLFFVIKLLETMKGSTTWYLHFSFTSLNMLNCALNPFMYAFLNQTTTRKCHDVAHKILLRCCGFNGKDFEEIHKNSPFVVNCNARKDGVEKGERVGNSKIKFADVATPVYTRTIPLKEQFI